MRRIFFGVVLAGVALAAIAGAPRPAFAQGGFGEGDLELNLFFGGSWYSPNRYEIAFPQSSPPESKEFKLEKAFRGGVRFNVYNSGHWAEEFMYSYDHSHARFVSISPPGPELRLDMQVHQFAVNTLYFFDEDEEATVRPFLAAGIGGTLYRPNAEARAIARDPARGNLPGFEDSFMFAFNYGWGMKIRAGDSVGFRVDARGFVGKSPTFGLPRESQDPAATVFPAGGAIHNGEASAGVVFYLN